MKSSLACGEQSGIPGIEPEPRVLLGADLGATLAPEFH